MKKMSNSVKNGLVAVGVLVLTTSSQAAVTMPTVSYTDIEAAAVIGFGIAITVGLLMKAKRFLS
jgi:Flp pilus assembly protein protease CpaA